MRSAASARCVRWSSAGRRDDDCQIKAGVVWIQIPSKSMLMNAKIGQRMVDSCMQSEQRAATTARGGNVFTQIRFITVPYCFHRLPVL